MNKEQQQALARELADNFTAAYLDMANKAPDQWDGRELRQLLVDCAKERFAVEMRRQMAIEYRKARLVTPGL